HPPGARGDPPRAGATPAASFHLDRHLGGESAQGVEETDAQGARDVVPPARRPVLAGRPLATSEDLREEGRQARPPFPEIAEVETEFLGRTPPPGRTCLPRGDERLAILEIPVVLAAPLAVRKDVVGLGDALEALFGAPIARIQIGMMPPRE